MIQKVNLLIRESSAEIAGYSARQLGVALAAFLILMLVWLAFTEYSLKGVSANAQLAEQTANEKRVEAEALLAKVAKLVAEDEMIGRVARAEQVLKDKQQIMTFLQPQADAASGFSAYLEGLGRQKVEGLWLTRIAVSQNGAIMGLQCSTSYQDLLVSYLQKLGDEVYFGDREFTYMALERNEKVPTTLNFSLATKCASNDADMQSICAGVSGVDNE